MIKKFFKNIIIAVISFEAILVLKRYKPKVVAVTGSVGKTSTKDAVAAVLGNKFFARKSVKSYNSEVGIPLVILGCENGWSNPVLWFLNILKGLGIIFSPKKVHYPEWLIIEVGVERPGDMDRLSWIKPDAVVFTALAEIPPHVEFFAGPEDLVQEKMKLAQNLGIDKAVILNGDDKTLCEAKIKIKSRTLSFGFNEDVDLRASNYHISYIKNEKSGIDIPEGITFKADYKGSSVPVRIFGAELSLKGVMTVIPGRLLPKTCGFLM